MALQVHLKKTPTWCEGIKDDAIRSLAREIVCAIDIKSMCDARARFLVNSKERIPEYVRADGNRTEINLYGNDVDMIAALFSPIMEVSYRNVCDNPKCDSSTEWISSAPVSIVTIK